MIKAIAYKLLKTCVLLTLVSGAIIICVILFMGPGFLLVPVFFFAYFPPFFIVFFSCLADHLGRLLPWQLNHSDGLLRVIEGIGVYLFLLLPIPWVTSKKLKYAFLLLLFIVFVLNVKLFSEQVKQMNFNWK